MNHIELLFRNVLAEEEVLSDKDLIKSYTTDWRGRYHTDFSCVLRPTSVASVQKIMRLANQYHISVTPQGGNTGLCGGSIPSVKNSVILLLQKLNQVRIFSALDKSITVEAGMTLSEVQQYVATQGYYFPLSLASEGQCQIGGNIACNAGGVHVLRYGSMRDLVLGLEVVLPNGELVSQLSPLHKNTTGIDDKHIWIGSEGTLGVITAAALKIYAPIVAKTTVLVGCSSIAEVLRLLRELQLKYMHTLTAFEYMSKPVMELSQKFCNLSLALNAEHYVLCELGFSHKNEKNEEQFLETLLDLSFTEVLVAQSLREAADMWKLRENISEAQERLIGICIKHDIAVPISQLESFIQETAQAIQAEFYDAIVLLFGHFGDGSLHYNIALERDHTNGVYQFEEALNQIVYQQVVRHSGTIAAEHGIGQLKRKWLHLARTPEEIYLMKSIKYDLDENNIMNPGKVFPD